MRPQCFMLRENENGGGNTLGANSVIVRRTAAIGDAIAASVVVDKLIEQGFSVEYQTHINIHCVMRRHPKLTRITVPNGYCHVNLDGAYEKDPQRRNRHFYGMFMNAANDQLRAQGVYLGQAFNCRPRIVVHESARQAARAKLSQYPKPWTFMNPRSETYNVRQVPDAIWAAAATRMNGTCFWIGLHPAPSNIVDLKIKHLDTCIEMLSAADLLITVDTGPLHIGAALGVPVLALGQSSSPELHLGDQTDFLTIWPGPLECINCQENVCRINHWSPPCQQFDPSQIAHWATMKQRMYEADTVSAVVAIYKPDVNTLNRCLECLLPQVSEIIVTGAGDSVKPERALAHEKIRYVRKPHTKIGYGRNANFGVRHSTGKYILLMNDDVFLDPGAVQHLLDECKKDKVGMVANLLRYPDGTIYHAGKSRSPGVRGWGHIDYKKRDHSIKGPCEMENVCMACSMVPREVFYKIGGFDEEYFLFAEDDDFALRVRKAGYKIVFQPLSTGIHMEHQSVAKVGGVEHLVGAANSIFHKKWGAYLTFNLNRIPGTFDY